MKVEIFPSLNEPRIYVFLQYGGMSPAQMEGLIVNQFELLFQYVDGVSEIQSRSIQQVALVKLSFFPGTDMGVAEAAVVAMSNRAMSRMPPGTLPPMVMRLDEGSVPVGYLVLESKKTPLGLVADYAQNIIRPLVQQNVPGTVAVSPIGPNARSILVNVDPQKLQSYNLSPQDVVDSADDRQRHHSGGQPVHPRPDADGAVERAGRRHPGHRQDPAQDGAQRLRARRRQDRRQHRRRLRQCAGQWQEVGLSADHQEGHRFDA